MYKRQPLGLFYGGGASFLASQAIGVVSVIAWVAATMTIVFLLIKKTIGLRASKEEEIRGLDATEHNLSSSYADFMPAVPQILSGEMCIRDRYNSPHIYPDPPR